MTWLDNAKITTVEQKQAAKAEANRQAAKAERDKELNEITYTTGSGHVIQCREKDEVRLRRQLERMKEEKTQTAPWISLDNNIIEITQNDLKKALKHGEDKVAEIFEKYIESL